MKQNLFAMFAAAALLLGITGCTAVEVGKDADFLVFDNDLLTAEHSGLSHDNASEVYICGKKMN